jgi:hypothetical protein
MANAGLLRRPSVVKVSDHLGDLNWRLNNLYFITTKEGKKVKFELNSAQADFFERMHTMNVILKARQLGFTTVIQIFMLDQIVFNSNVNAGTIAHNLGDAMSIFQSKIKFPYDNLPDGIKALRHCIRDSRTELALSNNSSIRVGVSMRSGTLNYLHVSEYGKLCAKFADKAREVKTGALNTVQAGQWVTVESTAEGAEGGFYDMCQTARSSQRTGARLTELDFKFHFYPWHREPAYRINPDGVVIGAGLAKYFAELEAHHGIVLDAWQKAWYAKKSADQSGDMKREFPSTPDEAFEASVEGSYYGAWIEAAEVQGRVGAFTAEPGYPVHTAFDIGIGDATSIWFWQRLPNEVRVLGYLQNSGEGIPYYAAAVRDLYEKNGWSREGAIDYVPHDARVKEWGSAKTRLEQLTEAKFKPRIATEMSIDDGINAVRATLPMCTFDAAGCSEGLKALKSYRHEWNDDAGCWRSTPLHNWASHGSDAFRYLCAAHRDIAPPKIEHTKPDNGMGSVNAMIQSQIRSARNQRR